MGWCVIKHAVEQRFLTNDHPGICDNALMVSSRTDKAAAGICYLRSSLDAVVFAAE